MKLEYFIKKRKVFNLKSGKTEEKYIAALLQKSRITKESIYKEVEVSCTLSAPEAALAIDEISDVILSSMRLSGSIGQTRLMAPFFRRQSPR